MLMQNQSEKWEVSERRPDGEKMLLEHCKSPKKEKKKMIMKLKLQLLKKLQIVLLPNESVTSLSGNYLQ